MNYLFILGSNPILSLAEISSLFPQASISSLAQNIALIKLNQEIAKPQELLDKMGGTVKIARLVSQINSNDLVSSLTDCILTHFSDYRDIGLSHFNFSQPMGKYFVNTKKNLKQYNINKRFIFENNENQLKAATIKRNKLLSKGAEIIIIKSDEHFYFGQSVACQDIDQYTKRDYGKPKPDAFSGMLPPKVAQIMINLAQLTPEAVIYDPFCGSGTILQEALLQKFTILGSDISEKAVIHTRENLKWLIKNFYLSFPDYKKYLTDKIFVADAASFVPNQQIDAIITEPFLGPALKNTPSENFANQQIRNLMPLYRNFFQNALKFLKEKGKIVFILPVYVSPDKKITFPINTLLDQNLQKHYTILSKDLIYQQPSQKVNRQILVLSKN